MLGHLVSNSVPHLEPRSSGNWFKRFIAFLFGARRA
jgi:hypothetical protein